ncbi:MAG: lamin tail domain-containing protein, partial [Flavobacteriales bacterium]
PLVIASTTALPSFDQTVGDPSSAQNLTVSGSNLTGDVTVAVPTPFEISTTEASGYSASIDLAESGGTLSSTTVYVRMNSGSSGAFSGQFSITSPGALEATVGLSGTAISNSLPAVFINELMASNASTITDENGEYDDWFEIYNSTSAAVDLAGWYASDDATHLTKYQFPIGSTVAIVPANGFLLVWADNQPEQGDLHTDFALSSNGEAVILTAPDAVSVADSISFGPQTTDISYGRQSDGLLPWISFVVPTPGASNQGATVIIAHTAATVLSAWPNPVVGNLLHFDHQVTGEVLGIDGRIVARVTHALELQTADLASGTYVLRTSDGAAASFLIP